MLQASLLLQLLPSHVNGVYMLLLSSLHAVAGFITFVSIPAVVGVPTELVVLLLLSFLLLPSSCCCGRSCYCCHPCCCLLLSSLLLLASL